jgi:hypothetical protein
LIHFEENAMGTAKTARGFRDVLVKRQDLTNVIFGVGLLAAVRRLWQQAGAQAALGADSHQHPEHAVRVFIEELKALGYASALPVSVLELAAGEARQRIEGMATWFELYCAAQRLEVTAAAAVAACIEEAHQAAVDPFDGPAPDSYTAATLGILRSAWTALGEAGYAELAPGFYPPLPRLPTVAGAAPM